MKNGFLFFLNMGRITTIARISIVPLFLCVINIPFHSILYTLSCILFVLSILLSIIPAPSDKVVDKIIAGFQSDLQQRLLHCCRVKNGDVVILRGYEKSGKMILRRQLGKNVVYPHLAAIGFCTTKNKTVLVIARKSLLSNELAKYQEIECNSNTRFCIETNVINNDETVIELKFSVEGTKDQIIMFAKSDYHYRDLLSAIQNFSKNDI